MSELTASDLEGFLADRSWQKVQESDRASMWQFGSGSSDVIVPKAMSIRSYEWDGVISRVADEMGATMDSVLVGVAYRFTDGVDVGAIGDTRGDSIPLFAADSIIEAAKRIVRASATAAMRPRAEIGSNYSRGGDLIAERARLGLTRRGSYVVPIYLDLPRIRQERLGEQRSLLRVHSESVERRVTRTIAEAIEAIDRHIVSPVAELQASEVHNLLLAGVTRETVRALSSALEPDPVSQLTFSFRWASAVPAPPRSTAPVSIPAEARPRLDRAAKLMRRGRKTRVEQFTGTIRQVRREDEDLTYAWVQTVRNSRPTEVMVTVRGEDARSAYDWAKNLETMVVGGAVESVPGVGPRINVADAFYPLASAQLPGSAET